MIDCNKIINNLLYDGKDGKKIAAEIVSIFEREQLTIQAAENIIEDVKKLLGKVKIQNL